MDWRHTGIVCAAAIVLSLCGEALAAEDAVAGDAAGRLVLPEFEVDAAVAPPSPVTTDNIHAEQTAIPLPPGAWTGLAGLSALALAGVRRQVMRFLT